MTKEAKALFNALPVAMVIHLNGEIIMASQECSRLLGYDASTDLSQIKSFLTVFKRDHKNENANYISKHGKAVIIDQATSPILVKGKSCECTTLRANEAKSSQNNGDNAVAMNAANVARSRFLAAMSHEMRTPLNSVINGTILLSQTTLDTRQDEIVDMVQSSANELLHRVEDILTYSQLEEREMPDQTIEFNLCQILTPIVRDFSATARDKNVAFVANIDENANNVFLGYPERFSRIVRHLANNAVSHTHGGEVKLSVDFGEGGHGIFVEISDTGTGIAPERLANIFDPFNFDSDPAKRAIGGLSLGLALSNRIAKSLGGWLEMKSNLGLGTIAKIYVPFELAQAESDDSDDCEPMALNILVAEDNKTNQKVISLILSQMGHQITTADDGLLCVEQAKLQDFDAILMDLHMPNMDGYEAAREIRKIGMDIPIFALTADNRPEAHKNASEAGMDGFLTKPLVIARLFEVLSEVALQKQVRMQSRRAA
ncbi:MAG: multi-sensor hybrid histidine kinase [Hyphomonadaceae bacterium]|nr:MAG: multi-sensor hybrid histidine kinase [Hyphomonadaceae bacterium]